MGDKLKEFGAMAGAATAVWIVFAGIISVFGGHIPPYPTLAWAQTQDQITQQNLRQIAQLNALIISDKVVQLSVAVANNPNDVNLKQSLAYWQQQLAIAQANALPPKK